MNSIMERSYQRILALAGHRCAHYYLIGLSIIESIFFPVPPDAMLIPMVLAQPNRAMKLATFTMLASVFGGLIAYGIGFYAFAEYGTSLLDFLGYEEKFQQVLAWFESWGFAFVVIAGFTPIPYKLITLSAGCVGMDLPLFIIGSLLGRGARFYLVAYLLRFGKAAFESIWLPRLARFSNAIIIGSLLVGLAIYLYGKYGHA
jgi:membrane protein YqaA with SNARE-associated domain